MCVTEKMEGREKERERERERERENPRRWERYSAKEEKKWWRRDTNLRSHFETKTYFLIDVTYLESPSA